MACDKAPYTGRLYHRRAILSQRNSISQLCYYIKSLTVPFPYHPARRSILALVQGVVPRTGQERERFRGRTKDEEHFITAYAYLFLASQDQESPKEAAKEDYDLLPAVYLTELDAVLKAIERGEEYIDISVTVDKPSPYTLRPRYILHYPHPQS